MPFPCWGLPRCNAYSTSRGSHPGQRTPPAAIGWSWWAWPRDPPLRGTGGGRHVLVRLASFHVATRRHDTETVWATRTRRRGTKPSPNGLRSEVAFTARGTSGAPNYLFSIIQSVLIIIYFLNIFFHDACKQVAVPTEKHTF